MDCHIQAHGTVGVAAPQGPLLGEELEGVRTRLTGLINDKAGRVVLDMTEVPYLDSGGIELLLEYCGAHRPGAARPRVAHLSETCREALDLTNVLQRLDVFDTVEAAVRSFKR